MSSQSRSGKWRAGDIVTRARALGNPDRLMLMCQLSQGEFSVGELEGLVGLREPVVAFLDKLNGAGP